MGEFYEKEKNRQNADFWKNPVRHSFPIFSQMGETGFLKNPVQFTLNFAVDLRGAWI